MKPLTLLSIPLFLLCVAATGCTRSSAPSSAAPELRNGQKIFDFDYKKVSRLSLVKSDPRTGDQWTAEVRKNGSEAMDWEIVAAPVAIIDRRAHGTWIEHLLDTLHTLTAAEPAPAGPLASFGLEPPRFGLSWSPPEGGMEVRLGNAVDNDAQGAGAYAIVPPSNKVYLVRGAALPMLDLLDSFNALRLQTLATFDVDDVAEIEVRRPDKRKFYAQRDGETWADAKHRPLKKDLKSKLEAVAHARILAFIDNPLRTQQLLAVLDRDWRVEFEARDIHGAPTVIRLTKSGARFFGKISSRKDSVFELYPQLPQTMLSFF